MRPKVLEILPCIGLTATYVIETMFVSYNNKNSEMENVSYGVLHGSVLGSLLFILYINVIANCLQFARAILFAADTSVSYAHENIEYRFDVMISDLDNLNDCFKAYRLSLNVSKSCYILFPSSNKNAENVLKIGTEPLKKETITKSLCVCIDCTG